MTALTMKTETVLVDCIDDPGVEVRPDLLNAIKALGFLINPLYLRPRAKDRYEVLWGKHRTACLRHLRRAGAHGRDQWETVEAVVDRRKATAEVKDVRAMAVLIENHIRATNPGAEIDAVVQLSRNMTENQIAKATGLKLRIIKDLKRLKMGLHDEAIEALRAGDLTLSAGKEMLKISQDRQRELVATSEGRIRVKDVAAAVRQKQASLLRPLDDLPPRYSVLTDLANQLDVAAGSFAGEQRKLLVNAAEILRSQS